jgi:hypothetical protein
MKLAILAILFSVVTFRAQAQVHYDSLAADSLLTLGGDDVSSAKGLPDHSDAVLTNANSNIIAQFFHGGKRAATFQQGAPIHVFWDRTTTDTFKAWVVLKTYTNQGVEVPRKGDTIMVTEAGYGTGMFSITAGDTGFNAVEIDPDTTRPIHSFFVDAIVLKQSGTIDTTSNASVREQFAMNDGLACYPNPFPHTSGTTIYLPADKRDGTLIVTDMLGREVRSLSARDDLRIALDAPGIYFVRRRVGSEWVGAPIRISAQ